MSGKKRSTGSRYKKIGSDLKKVDAYAIGPKDYEEIPELSDEWFERADVHEGGKLVRRGRPPLPEPKQSTSLRLDADVLAHYRGTGRGWQSRINAALRKAAKLPEKKRKKA